MLPEFLKLLKNEAIQMLSQWSADILEIWTEVYAYTVASIGQSK
jgi:hypothetical protein